MINKKIKSPYKRDFGKKIHDEQRRGITYKPYDESLQHDDVPYLQRTKTKRGRI